MRFPLGGLDKAETRRHAERFALPVADKPESQDICFVPNGSYARVVERMRPGALDAGQIVDLDGKVLGDHDGIINFTVGQRRGLGVAAGEPLYVVRIEPETNRVVIGTKEALLVPEIGVGELNWLDHVPLTDQPRRAQVKVRSTTEPVWADISATETGAHVRFVDPQAGVAPGQACVIYDGSKVLGGGWILRH